MNTPEKKRYTIGIMLGDIQSDYSEDLISGFYTCAREEDVNLIFLMDRRRRFTAQTFF